MGKIATSFQTSVRISNQVSAVAIKWLKRALVILALCLLHCVVHAQTPYCNAAVPTFTVNMTGNPNGSWVSPNIGRNDYCCGVTGNDACVQFIITLDPMSTGIIFNIASGAVPPGALFYQINCGPQTQVGAPICLTGVGPHYLSFCKPGGNTNTYSINALALPSAGPNLTVNDGCSATMYCTGFDDTTITWTSIFPGNPGQYNSFLSCTQDCDTVSVTPSGFIPPYVDYQVCGASIGGCGQTPTCDTLRVHFNPPLIASILPVNPTVCFGNTGTNITVNVQGGSPPYSYIWSTGATTQTIYVPPGTYSVQVSDTSNCPPTVATVTVGSFTATITANAGPDIHLCNNAFPIQLNGSVTGVTTGQWFGGSGVFQPSSTALNATYMPTSSEVSAGQVTLSLATTYNGSCPPDTDQVVIYFHQFAASISLSSTDASCYGSNNGTATVSVTGSNGPFTYQWSTTPIQTSTTASGLAPGTYSVLVTDINGCTGASSQVTINQPSAVTLSAAGVPAACNAVCNGQLVAVPGGGTLPYSLLWSTGCTTLSCNNICAGNYTVLLTDANGCSISTTATVTEPTPIIISTTSTSANCNQSNGSITANVSGGSPGYTYLWIPGNQAGPTANSLSPGNYTVTVTDAQGCTANGYDAVNNQPGVTAVVGNIMSPTCSNTCDGTATGYGTSGNGPYQFNWSNSATGNTVTNLCPSPAAYVLTVTDANGCTDTASFIISTPTPVTVTVQAPAPICIGQSVTLTASGSGGTPGYAYTWSSGSPTVSPATTTTYTVTATDANGCQSPQASVTVFVNPPLNITVNTIPTVCANSQVILSALASGGNGGPYIYNWQPGNLSGPVVTVTPSSTTIYTVTVTDNCTSPVATGIVHVATWVPPLVSFISDDTSGCEGACVQFTNTSPTAVGWLWNFGDGNNSTTASPSNCYLAAGHYNVSLTVTDANGCTNTINLPSYMTIFEGPVADFTLGPQPTTILDPQICFTDHSSSDVVSWYWNFGDPNDATVSFMQNPCHSYSDTGTYYTDLVVHNANGCMSHQQYNLRIDSYFQIFVPNAFSPNNDGLNDVFLPLMFNVKEEGYLLQIFDRWGNLIFETTDIYKSWDGRANNSDTHAQIDTYVWKIKVEDYTGRLHKMIGHVSIIR